MSPITDRTAVLIVAMLYPPDPYSGAARPHRFSKYLRRLGYQVDVIAGGTRSRCVNADNVYRVQAQYLHLPEPSLLEIAVRVTLFPNDWGFEWVPRVIRVAEQWRGESRLIISTSPPLTNHLAALWAKKKFGWRWIADFRDPLVGNPYRAERTRKVDEYVERLFFRNADAVIANTDPVAEMWRIRYPKWREKIETLWNGFDPEDGLQAVPVPSRPYRVYRHVGAIYGDRYPHLLLNSLQRLIESGRCDISALHLEMIGFCDAPRTWPDTQMSWFKCDGVEVAKAEADRLAAESDGLILLDATKSKTPLQLPAKIFDYVRIGRPILVCTLPDSPADRVLSRSGIPYVCLYPQDAPDEIDSKVLKYLSFPSDSAKPSEWFQCTFDALAQAQKLAALIDNVQSRS